MLKINEAAKLHSEIQPCGVWKDDAIKSFKGGVEFAQRWISVEDELPKEGVSVLTKNDFGCIGIEILENGIWRMCTVEKIAGLLNLKEYELEKFASPTHWRPIELK